MGGRILILCFVLLGGCVRYYRVTDPGGGHVYFTQQVDEQSSGAVKFNDMQTGCASRFKRLK